VLKRSRPRSCVGAVEPKARTCRPRPPLGEPGYEHTHLSTSTSFVLEICVVSTNEILSQLDLPSLKKLAKRLGIHVPQGLTGFFAKEQLGIEIRRPYIKALANSELVTLDEIDRVLGTHYARMHYDLPSGEERGIKGFERSQKAPESPARGRVRGDFQTRESILQHAMNRYLYKEDVQDLCRELNLPGGGNKDELVLRVLGAPELHPDMVFEHINKEDLKELCIDLNLGTHGTREDLVDRLIRTTHARAVARPPPQSYLQYTAPPQTSMQPKQDSPLIYPEPRMTVQGMQAAPPPVQEVVTPPPLEFPEEPSPTLIPEPIAPQIAQLQMVSEFLEGYRPSQRFRNESAYEIEVAQAMRHHFGSENVKTQANIAGGRIDIEVLGIGVELKVPASRGQLQTLLGQTQIYRNYYGANLIVVVFNDLAKYQDVNEFANILRSRGIQVFVK